MTHTSRLASAAGLLLLSGCYPLDPLQAPDSWHANGANQANLATMVADPHDLARGRGMTPTDGSTAVSAIDRLRHDHLKPLIDTNGSSASASGSAASPAAN